MGDEQRRSDAWDANADPYDACHVPPAHDSDTLANEESAAWWKQTREHELRQLLFWRWDPIGVFDPFSITADEYDGDAPQLVRALPDDASDERLARMIRSFEQELMGLSPRPDVNRVQTLIGLLRLCFENSQACWRDFGLV